MKSLPATTENIKIAANIIKKGGIVAFPTETVYGLGADALNPVAVSRIFEAKNRPSFDPLIVHIADIGELKRLSVEIPETAERLAEKFWPGPLTMVLKKSSVVPDIVTSGLPTLAVRIPVHPAALELIKEAQTPIAAPSANPFGFISPTKAAHVEEQLGNMVDLILDGGPCDIGLESTIIKIDEHGTALLRPGGLPVEEIERITGPVRRNSIGKAPDAPGQMPSHYSPGVPLVIIRDIEDITDRKNAALLAFKSHGKISDFKAVQVLSEKGDLNEAAANLFSCLHRLSKSGVEKIYAEAVPEKGLGIAIMDRLKKASY